MCRETHEQWAVVDLERLVVSMPSRELLVQQPEDYQQSAIPSDIMTGVLIGQASVF